MQAVAEKHKQLVLSSGYWQLVKQTKDMLEPLVKLLRLCDGDTPTAGKVHYYAHKVRCEPLLKQWEMQLCWRACRSNVGK
jgi:hypothetical protein